MNNGLTSLQQEARASFRAFVQQYIVPVADSNDREQSTPLSLIQTMAQHGYLGACIPQQFGGSEMDMLTFGILHEEVGRGCSSLRSLLTVHSMLSHAILRWGNTSQKQRWLPRLARGEIVGAFSLSEPLAGSDARSIQTSITMQGEYYILNGHKKWVTYGQIADLFLLFAQQEGRLSAFLIERDTPGLSIHPLKNMLGTRASMLAELHLDDCRVLKENVVGRRDFALEMVAATCLDLGRYSVACGCVGIAQASLDASLHYASQHKQFGSYLKEHQLIQEMITNMVANTQAARLLCYQAGHLKENGDPETIMATWVAKYFASVTASKSAKDAVQIHGANGCSSDYPVQRYLRDATIMEIIEGSTQIQQMMIAQYYDQK